jgi:hypothetical protein
MREPRPVPSATCDAIVRAVVDVEAPRVVEIVLAAGPLDRRLRRAVDPEEVVALAEPARLRLHDGEHGADVVALALRLEEDVVRAVGGRRQHLPVARVEVRDVRRQRRHLLPVDVVVQVGAAAAALVRDRDAGRLLERHRPVAVARAAVGAVDHHERLHLRLEPVPDGEEVADRRVDARDRAAVVVDPEAEQLRPAVLVVRDRHPEVRDDAGALQVGEHGRLTGNRPLAVVVRVPVRVVRRRAIGGEVLGLEEAVRVRQTRHGLLRNGRDGEAEQTGSGETGDRLHGILTKGAVI